MQEERREEEREQERATDQWVEFPQIREERCPNREHSQYFSVAGHHVLLNNESLQWFPSNFIFPWAQSALCLQPAQVVPRPCSQGFVTQRCSFRDYWKLTHGGKCERVWIVQLQAIAPSPSQFPLNALPSNALRMYNIVSDCLLVCFISHALEGNLAKTSLQETRD